MAAIVRKQTKRSKRPQNKPDMSDFDLTQESGKKNDTGEGETPVVDRLAKKRPAADFEEEVTCAVGKGVQSMMEKFGTDINKVMQAKRKRLESLTKNFMKGSQHTLEQRWNNQYTQRQKLTQQYSQQVSSALQLWESDTQRIEDQQEKLNNLFRQQQELFQQAKVAQTQKLKIMRELYEQFVKDIEEMEKSHEAYVQGAQQELKKELSCLLKKSLMDMQQEQMATVRNSLQSTLF
ncbi:synaptonemal complex protein 3 [Myripristis murdjan]|uniref:Synaptonemal complex protein 3 n=1 Tax=Myripristis murdjan TaxID=586833 RepID=A0A667ZGX7_9TELE|nr:synaptonemal complex protein 3 [Myripristis murdjan]